MRTRFQRHAYGNDVPMYEQPICKYSVQKLNAAINIVLEKRLNRYVKKLKVDEVEMEHPFFHQSMPGQTARATAQIINL